MSTTATTQSTTQSTTAASKAARESRTADFLSAQLFLCGVYLASEAARQDAFRASAVAASAALASGVTLQRLRDANFDATADMVETAPKGTLYRSLASVQLHAFTGDILTLPASCQEFDDDAPAPTELQTLVRKALTVIGAKGASGVKARIKRAKSQAEFVAGIVAELDKRAEKSIDATIAAENSAPREDSGQTLETLLSRVLKMTESGEVSDAALSLIVSVAQAAGVPIVSDVAAAA